MNVLANINVQLTIIVIIPKMNIHPLMWWGVWMTNTPGITWHVDYKVDNSELDTWDHATGEVYNFVLFTKPRQGKKEGLVVLEPSLPSGSKTTNIPPSTYNLIYDTLLHYNFFYCIHHVLFLFHHCPCMKRDTAGQERFRPITAFYLCYRGVMVCIVIIIIIYMVKWKRSLFNVSLWCCPTF